MKRSISLNCCILLFCISIYGQTQLTEFETIVTTFKYDIHGLVNIDGIDYIIENDASNLRVSKIQDEVEILYEVSDFPSSAHQYFGRLSTRSGYLIEGHYLYEIFKDAIRKRNLLTSEIEAVFDFPSGELQYLNNLRIYKNILHMRFWKNHDFATFNMSTNKFNVLPFKSFETLRSQNTYITRNEDEGIKIYDSVEETTSISFEDEVAFHITFNNVLSNQSGALFVNFYNFRFANADTSFLIDCDLLESDFAFDITIRESEENYLLIYNDHYNAVIKVLNKADCTDATRIVIPLDFDDFHTSFYNTKAINDDYIFFSLLSNFRSYHFIFDKNDSSLTQIEDDDLRRIFGNTLFRNNEQLYFVGTNFADPYPDKHIFSINLQTKELTKQLIPSYPFTALSLGASDMDSVLHLVKNANNTFSLKNFKNFSDQETLQTFSDYRNFGIININYLALIKDKMAFKFKGELYVVDNNSNSPEKITSINSAPEISDVLMDDNLLTGLLNYNDTTFIFNHNFANGTFTQSPLEEFTSYISNSFAFSKYLFGSFSIVYKKYFDFDLHNFVPIPIVDDIISIHKSNKHVLFLKSGDAGYSMTSFINEEFVNFPITYSSKPTIISKNNGEFFILENSSGNNVKISVIKHDGSLGDQITSSGFKLSYNQDNIENGPLSAFMFYSHVSDEFEIIMHRYNDFHRYKIPFTHAHSYPIVWYKAGNSIVLKSEDGHEPGIYICTIGKEPKKLVLNDVGFTKYKLLFATHNQGIITFMVQSSLGKYEVVQYNVATETITKTNTEVEDYYFDYYILNTTYRIAPNKYYVVFPYPFHYEDYENKELYIFDANSLTLEPSIDLNQRPQESNPHRFVESSSHLYFIARSPEDNSYQLFAKEKEELTTVKNMRTNHAHLIIQPNPSSDYISLKVDAQSVQIRDVDGQIMKQLESINKNENIDISMLPSGTYFIEAITNNKKSSSLFIKI